MKVLITVFDILDYGGIIADVELLMRGLEELGHAYQLVILRSGDRDPYLRKPHGGGRVGAYTSKGARGALAHTMGGWYNVRVMSYGSKERIAEWQQFASNFDVVLHEIPGPKPDPDGMWAQIYDISPPQMIIAHDAHFRRDYPHIALIAHKLSGISCTNHAGYVGLSWMPTRRVFIGAPHAPLRDEWSKMPPWNKRSKTAVSAHVWKRWKNMHRVVQVAPYVETQIVTAGSGIEYHYMTSKEKRKAEYGKIWEKAVKAGMKYMGMLTPDQLFALYQKSRLMLDMSYSKKYAATGNHFNRSIIEGFNNGVVPVCVIENMTDAVPAQVTLWEEGKNYIGVPQKAGLGELADTIDRAARLPAAQADEIVHNGRRVLEKYFDYRKNTQAFLDFATGKRLDVGIYPQSEVGHVTAELLRSIHAHLHSNSR